MEELDDQTIQELKAKAIERGGDDSDISTNEINEELIEQEPPVADEGSDVVEEEPVKEAKKPKRQRSEKQKAAFEKARLARAENLKIKKQIEAEKKQKQKEEKEQVKIEVKKRLQKKEQVQQTEPKVETPLHNPLRPTDIHRFAGDMYDEPGHRYREQVVNNYYYYGAKPSGAMEWQDPEPSAKLAKQKRGRKKKVVVKEPEPEYSSESASEAEESEEEIVYSDPEEPQSYKELQNYDEEEERQLPQQKSNGLKFRFA